MKKCRICGKTYATKYTLRRHKRDQHPDRLEFECPYCFRSFDEMKTLRQHVSLVHNSKLREFDHLRKKRRGELLNGH